MARGDAVLIYSQQKVLASHALEAFFALLRPFLIPRKRPLPESPIIVLIEPFHMGDVLALAVMLDPILARFPRARVVLWCHSRNAHVYQHDPRIWKIISAPFPWSNRGSKRGTLKDWRAVLSSTRELRALHPDVAIDTRGDIRSQIAMLLAGSNQRIGYTTYIHSNIQLRGLLLTHPLAEPPETHRYLTNLHTLQPVLGQIPELHLPALPLPPTELSFRPEAQSAAVEKPATGSYAHPRTILLHPGAGWLYRRWPLERWSALIEKLQPLPDVQLILIVGPEELEVTEQINRTLNHPIETRTTTYEELLTLIAQASLFLCLDSGPMHAAVLMNIPVLALFGPGESRVWCPLSQHSRYFHHIENYPCHPCTQTTCVRPSDPCMTTIQVDEVVEAARTILTTTPNKLSS